jgi:hypothetical protein
MDDIIGNKKHRTPPRVGVINDVETVMMPHLDAIEVLLTRSDNDMIAESETLSTLVREHLTAMRVGVEALRTGPIQTSKDDTTTISPTKRGGGTHFVGVSGDGKVMYLYHKEGIYHPIDAARDTLVAIHGPFNTKEGAEYSITHNTYTSRPKVQ